MLKILKNRNFSLLFAGSLVSQIGTTFYNFAVLWFILSLTESPFQAGLYIAVGSILQLVITPLAGVFIDRFNKVRIVYLTDFIRGIVVIVAGLLIFTFNQETYLLFILYATTVILAINNAFFSPSVMALTPEIVPDEDLNQANAFFSLIRSFQAIIGVLLAGIFYSILGIEMIFIINGASFLLSGFSEMFIRLKVKEKVVKVAQNFGSDLKEGIIYIVNKPGFIAFLIAILFLNFAMSPLFANVLPVFFNLELAKEPIHLSGVQIAFSVGMLIGGIAMGIIGKKVTINNILKKALTGTIIGMAALSLLMHFVLNGFLDYSLFYVLFIVTSVLMAITNMFVNIPLQTAIMRIIDEDVRGRVMSVLDTLTQGLIPLAIVIIGGLLEVLIISWVLVILFGLILVPYGVVLFGRRINGLLQTL